MSRRPATAAPLVVAALLVVTAPGRPATAAASEDAASETAASQAAPVDPPSLTLADATTEAFERSPELAVAQALVAEAEGRLVGARTYPHNPEVEGEVARRANESEVNLDWDVGVSQAFEIAGQRGQRTHVARAELDAARARLARSRRLLAARVELAFLDALEARERLELVREEAGLAESLHDLAARRLAAGAGTRLDVNVAAAELGRAEQAVGVARADFSASRARLAEVVGLDPAALPFPEGDLAAPPQPLPELKPLLASAKAHRADLLALQEERRAAEAAVELARRDAWPEVTVGAFVGQEEGTDTITGLGLAVPLPLFDRNQGAVAERRAATRRLDAELASVRLAIGREVVATYERHRALRDSLALLEQRVVGTTEANLELLRRSFEEGKASWLEVLVMRRSLFDARRALVETRAEARRAHVTLALAAGLMPLPSSDDGDDR